MANDTPRRPRKVDKIEKESRLLAVEELLVSGIGTARIERELARKFSVTVRHVRRYIAEVRQRWVEESQEDQAHRREKLIRMAERLYAKAYAADRFGPANSALQTLARLGGAFANGQIDRGRFVETLGPPPKDDPTKALIYAQNVLVLSMQDIAQDPSIDPERRWRLLGDLAAKVGMTHSRTVLQNELDTVKQRVLGPNEQATGPQTLADVARPPTARKPAALRIVDESPGPNESPDSEE
jgi:hypothetical protein